MERNNVIYVITAMEDPVVEGRSRSFFFNADEARNCIINNEGDIYENGEYPYVVLEEISEGICPEVLDSEWYLWDESLCGYVNIKKPQEAEHLSNYSIG